MLVEILKPFPFSRDGVTSEQAEVCPSADIPDHLVPGLRAEGYVRETKAMAGAPKNKMEPPLENKSDAAPAPEDSGSDETNAKTAPKGAKS